MPTEGSGEVAVDSCSELQYLDTVCVSASVEEAAKEILNEYMNDEHFNKCRWLRDNRAAQYIRNLFRC